MSHPGYSDSGFRIGYQVARHLPRPVCRGIGSTLALASYHTKPQQRTALRANLQTVSGLDGPPLDALCRANYLHFGRMLADYFYVSSRDPDDIRTVLENWSGIEHLRTGLHRGKGVLLITAHLGNWELGGTLLALDGWPINVVTLEEPTSELTEMRDRYRQRLGIRTIAVGEDTFAFVEVIAALRRNEIVCMLVERPYGETGLPVRFFDRQTAFSTAPALLWQHTEATIIPAFVLENGRGLYRAFAESPLPFCDHGDRQLTLSRNTQCVATRFEAVIRDHPEQWFNYVPIWKL